MLSLLLQRNYALLWSSSTISALGNWLLAAALPYYVYTVTGSTIASGASIVSEIAPMVILPSIGGVFADRWDRKRVMVWSDVLRGLILLPLLAVHSSGTVWIVYLVGFTGSTVSFFAGPFGSAAIPQLVKAEQLGVANSGFLIGGNIGRLAGPAIAGVVLASTGLRGIVITDSLTFAVSALLVWLLVFPPSTLSDDSPAASPRTPVWRQWQQGLSAVRGDRQLSILMTVIFAACVGGGLFDPLLAPFVSHVLHSSAQIYGSLVTVRGAGGLLGSMVAGAVLARFDLRKVIGWSGILGGATVITVASIATVPATYIFVGMGTFLGSSVFLGQQTLLQTSVPDAYRGRVFGMFLSGVALCFLFGTAAGSLLASVIGIRMTMGVGGAIQCLADLALLWTSGAARARVAPTAPARP